MITNQQQTKNSELKGESRGTEKVGLERYEEGWKKQGFDFKQTTEWIDLGLKSYEHDFASYLRQKGYHSTTPNIKEIIQKESWRNIHSDFSYKYRKNWEGQSFSFEETKKWIVLGFKPDNISGTSKWKKEFGFEQTSRWIRYIGLNVDEIGIAIYAKSKDYPISTSVKKLREEYYCQAQNWLEKNYSRKEDISDLRVESWRTVPIRVNDSSQAYKDWMLFGDAGDDEQNAKFEEERVEKIRDKLEGFLKLEGFTKLKKLYCLDNRLTGLEIINCPNLEEVYCQNNQLTKLNIQTCKNLKDLSCHNNLLIDLNLSQNNRLEKLDISSNNFPEQGLSIFSHLVNLKRLDLGNHNKAKINKGTYNRFTDSLEPLKRMDKLEEFDISNTDIDSGVEYLPSNIKKVSYSTKARPQSKTQKITEQLDLITNEKGVKSKWEEFGFACIQALEWINAGAKLDDYEFVAWFRNTKNLTPEWITNYKEDYQILSKRFKKYGLCPECNQPNTGEKWCQVCISKHSQQNFPNWTSKNSQIDQFIQKYQLAATDADKFLEWIPYEQFKDVEYLAKGGFGEVYKAKWMKGNVLYWNIKNKQWQREKGSKKRISFYPLSLSRKTESHKKVVLKSLNNSQNNIEFLQETEKHKIIDDWFSSIVPCYGLSQDPATKNYLMVMQYMPEGNLRHYLSNKNKELTLKDKINHLVKIAQGLKDIHAKNLVHRDFHSGNILKGQDQYKKECIPIRKKIDKSICLITDLGLCKPANELSKQDQIFGVMPYVAPEVLRNKGYTLESDIYSFGIVAYEVLSGLPPYYDIEHDLQLALAICQGLRPQFKIKIPQLLESLIKRCWDTSPNQRPTANELEKTLRSWEKDAQFQNQLKEAEKYNQNLPDHIKYPDYKKKLHTGAVYHSRLLPTGEITRILSQFQETSGQVYLKETSDLESCAINVKNLNIQENEQTVQIIHNPPKNN